eukprot:2813143-Pleurochrysis_carterae.AAC.1
MSAFWRESPRRSWRQTSCPPTRRARTRAMQDPPRPPPSRRAHTSWQKGRPAHRMVPNALCARGNKQNTRPPRAEQRRSPPQAAYSRAHQSRVWGRDPTLCRGGGVLSSERGGGAR